jgi:hypothetical protein
VKKDFRTKNLLSEFALNPKFIEVCDCVFLSDTEEDLLPKERITDPQERYAIESLLNRRDIWDLFEIPPPDPTPRLCSEARTAVTEIWKSKLIVDFPNRRFMVWPEYSWPQCDVTLFQALDWHLELEHQIKTDQSFGRADWRPKLKQQNKL